MTPFPHHGLQDDDDHNPNLLSEDLTDEILAAERAKNPIAKMTASATLALAQLQRAVDNAVLYVNKETREIESQRQRNLRNETTH